MLRWWVHGKRETDMDLKVCHSISMLASDHARQLKEAGLIVDNHKVDAREFNPGVVAHKLGDSKECIENGGEPRD